jgi:hypothetical protein
VTTVLDSGRAYQDLANEPALLNLSDGLRPAHNPRCSGCEQALVNVPVDVELGAVAMIREISAPWCTTCKRFEFPPVVIDDLVEAFVDAAVQEVQPTRHVVRAGAWNHVSRTCPVITDVSAVGRPGLVLRSVPANYSAVGGLSFDPSAVAAARDRAVRVLSARPFTTSVNLSSEYGVGTHPNVLKIEPTTLCNLRCVFCPNPSIGKRHSISAAQFRSLWATAQPENLFKVSFTGLGESLLNPDLWEMVAVVSESGVPTSLVTNGTRLGDQAQAVLDSGLETIAVSIETIDASDFASTRRRARLGEILSGIDRLLELVRRRHSRLEVHVLAANVHGVSAAAGLIDWCSERGMEPPRFYPVYARFDPREGDDVSSHFGVNEFRPLIAMAQAKGVAISTPREVALTERTRAGATYLESVCIEPQEVLLVRANGRWEGCNEAIFSTTGIEEPAVEDLDISRMWQSQSMRRLRLGLSVGNPPDLCRGCPAFQIPLAARTRFA